jgi:hypothetical protein
MEYTLNTFRKLYKARGVNFLIQSIQCFIIKMLKLSSKFSVHVFTQAKLELIEL